MEIMSHMQVLSGKSPGFTVTELAVVLTVLGSLIGIVLFTLGSFYESDTRSLALSTQDSDTRAVLRSIENEIMNSPGFSTSLPVSAPLGPANDANTWSYMGNLSDKPTDRVLIARAYATDKAVSDNSRLPVFTSIDPGGSCDPSSSTPSQNSLSRGCAAKMSWGDRRLSR